MTLDRKHILVSEGGAASVVATLAEALGCRVLPDGAARGGPPAVDLEVVDAARPEALARASAPVVAVAERRLRRGEVQRLLAAGAARVFDGRACLFEAAFGLTELLFETCREQRRHAEAYGSFAVRFTDDQGAEQRGALVGLSRRGGRVAAETAPPEGATVTLVAEIGPWEVPVQGRVAYVDQGVRPGFGVEFALEQDPLAARIERFASDSGRPRRAKRRSASGVSA